MTQHSDSLFTRSRLPFFVPSSLVSEIIFFGFSRKLNRLAGFILKFDSTRFVSRSIYPMVLACLHSITHYYALSLANMRRCFIFTHSARIPLSLSRCFSLVFHFHLVLWLFVSKNMATYRYSGRERGSTPHRIEWANCRLSCRSSRLLPFTPPTTSSSQVSVSSFHFKVYTSVCVCSICFSFVFLSPTDFIDTDSKARSPLPRRHSIDHSQSQFI